MGSSLVVVVILPEMKKIQKKHTVRIIVNNRIGSGKLGFHNFVLSIPFGTLRFYLLLGIIRVCFNICVIF